MRKTNLKDLQNVLPIGVFSQGTFCKEFSLRPWRMKEERQIGQIRERGEVLNMSKFVSELLALMITKVGNIDFENKSYEERRLFVNQMYLSDVLYVYVFLRYQALGPDLYLDIICPTCKKKFTFKADLETLDIMVYEDINDSSELVEIVELQRGVEISGELRKQLRLRPNSWNAMESLKAATSANDGELKAELFKDSVIGYSDDGDALPQFIFNDEILDTLWKADIEEIKAHLEKVNAGASMIINGRCPECREEFFKGLDWNYDPFFAHSSLSDHPMS